MIAIGSLSPKSREPFAPEMNERGAERGPKALQWLSGTSLSED